MKMKYAIACIVVFLGAGLLLNVASSKDASTTTPATRPDGKTVTPTEAVAAFYRVLVQDAPPTYEQEKGVFGSSASGLRVHLIDKTGASKTQPVLLDLYRKHRDLFLPKNMKDAKDANCVALSSWFTFVGRPGKNAHPIEGGPTGKRGGYVIACFVDDFKAKPAHNRSVVFSVTEDGKLDADCIYLGGFDGQSAYEKFFDMKWWLEHHGNDVCP
jgi:hypothetical protein